MIAASVMKELKVFFVKLLSNKGMNEGTNEEMNKRMN